MTITHKSLLWRQEQSVHSDQVAKQKKKKKKEMNKLRLNGVSRSQMNEVSVPSESNQTKIWVICMFSIWSWTFSGNFTFTCSRLAPVEAPDRSVLVHDGVSSDYQQKTLRARPQSSSAISLTTGSRQRKCHHLVYFSLSLFPSNYHQLSE